MSKPRVQDTTTRTKQSGRIVLIRDGRIVPRRKRQTARLAACGSHTRL